MRTMYYLKGCYDVATSSIIENIRVNNPKALEEYVDAMEYLAKNHLIMEVSCYLKHI